ncbi:N-acetylmuramoyl-L-alanine amidase CwlH precursor [compost metagenome]
MTKIPTTINNGITIHKAKVFVDIVPKGNIKIRTQTTMVPTFITYHNTGNAGRGANAKSHNTYIHNLGSKLPRDTSHIGWHFTVDENAIYQHLPLNEIAYHCGDGIGQRSGNMTSIGIEICMHVDQKNYRQAEENAIALGVYLAQLLSIPISNHVPHQKWSGKYCPQVILKRDKTFTPFYNRIVAAMYTDNKLYRVRTGTFEKELQAKIIVDKIKKYNIASVVNIYQEGKYFRIRTGTYRGRAAALNAVNRMKELGLVKIADVEEP